jgi:hypothetical protein
MEVKQENHVWRLPTGTKSTINWRIELMALYNEVQTYYEAGLKIPDDMTLLFADDNFGSLRRVPTEEERKRSGGCGVSVTICLTVAPTNSLVLVLLSFPIHRWTAELQVDEQQHSCRLEYHALIAYTK